MDIYTDLCSTFSVPLWVAPLLHAASRLKSDRARRRKAYRLLQRRLMNNGVGCDVSDKPTYVYPSELKEVVRAAFPGEICGYEDPCHKNVFTVTMDDLNRLTSTNQS